MSELTGIINIGTSCTSSFEVAAAVTTNIVVSNYVDSTLSIGVLTELKSSSLVSSILLLNILEIGIIEELQSTSSTSSLVIGILSFGTYELMGDSISILTNINGSLKSQVRCINCKFNSKTLVKFSPKCFRAAQYKGDDYKLNCNMYKLYIKEN